jgi:hypothetical protein
MLSTNHNYFIFLPPIADFHTSHSSSHLSLQPVRDPEMRHLQTSPGIAILHFFHSVLTACCPPSFVEQQAPEVLDEGEEQVPHADAESGFERRLE